MSLSTVKKLDKRTRAGILAQVSRKFLPTFENFSLDSQASVGRGVVDEINKKFSSPVQGISDLKLDIVRKVLLNEIRASVVDGTQIKSVRERVGQKGLLRTDLYDIRFNQSFIETNVGLGVSKDLVTKTIGKPLAIDHLFPEKEGLTQVDSHSIFTAMHPSIGGCVVLVLTVRKLATLFVDGGWLMFLEDLNLHDVPTPLELLKAFAEHYGADLKNDEGTCKFIFQKSFPMQVGQSEQIFLEVVRLDNESIDTRLSFSTTHAQFQIALAFTIRLFKYVGDLKRHSVSITRSIPNFPKP